VNDRAFADLVSRARADPSVLGLVLHGSRVFEGMSTAHSDYDVCLIPAETEQGRRWKPQKSGGLDLHLASLAGFRSVLDSDDDAGRYITAHAQVLIDRLGGQVTAVTAEAATFPARSKERLPGMLDEYLNLLYRSLKNARDGRAVEAHLDAAASVGAALWVIFAMHQRVRPPNKYIRWELERHPLGAPQWDATALLPRVQRILNDGDPATQRALFHDIEEAARAGGLGEVVDGWGADLELMRRPPKTR
jgi:hypothetical protein